MPTLPYIQSNFTSGEWSPRLYGRSDLDKYKAACSTLKNFVVFPHGGATRRMGIHDIAAAKTTEVRLIPFQYNRDEAYVIELSDLVLRLYRNGAQIESSPGVPYELAHTYTEAELWEINFTQSADLLYLVHKDHAPAKIARSLGRW